MNQRSERTLLILVALLVLFSAMLAPLATAVISMVVLIALGLYKVLSHEKSG